MKPGEIPELNLPQKSFETPTSEPRSSSQSVIAKKQKFTELSTQSNVPSECYKTFNEFKKRVSSLKLQPSRVYKIFDAKK